MSSLSGVMNYLEARDSMAKAIQCGILHKLPALNELKSEVPTPLWPCLKQK